MRNRGAAQRAASQRGNRVLTLGNGLHPEDSVLFSIMRKNASSTPGEVISPLEHTHEAERLTAPGEVLSPLNQGAPSKTKERSKKTAAESLATPPKDKTQVTIAPTTSSGPDISIE